MDTSEQMTIETGSQVKRRRRSNEEKRRVVEETLEADASVARAARRHEINANKKWQARDLIKLLWWDGDGLCLFAKRLERGKFLWPQVTSGTVALTPAQLSMLLEGIDWRRPVRSYDPQMAV